MTTPTFIDFRAVEGWLIRIDEDGVQIRTPKGDALEQLAAQAVVDLFLEVVAMRSTGTMPVPAPPTRAELDAMPRGLRNSYTTRRAIRAIEREFGDDNTPF